MNIFVLDKSPVKSAHFLCDAHVVKMILESAQLLSTQDRLNGIDHGYRMTHKNHPCRICLENPINYHWLVVHLHELLREYTFRYHRIHQTRSIFTECWDRFPKRFSSVFTGQLTFPECMPDQYKTEQTEIEQVVAAYRNYYRYKQKTLPRFYYTGRAFPDWLKRDSDQILTGSPILADL